MGFTISGTIKREDNGQGIAGLSVEAFDADLFADDLLGTTQTDDHGAFAIKYQGKNELGDKPDIYLKIKNIKGELLQSTRNHIIYDVIKDIVIDVPISGPALAKADMVLQDKASIAKGSGTDSKSGLFRKLKIPPACISAKLSLQSFKQPDS
ncbi:hypothetical protein [Desulfobacterium sp. N47]|uniref:Carboxypeptidase regulatory-like domain-containing protein n=1 Tax=uncultured Desulfobacterium sp. TaxID=201089 RepID=E1YHU0_9BACT|nr:hypothetical protein N47_D30180 [uncultured Desulfobacterium sp.]